MELVDAPVQHEFEQVQDEVPTRAYILMYALPAQALEDTPPMALTISRVVEYK